ncbi:MAG TPA: M20/M25/M40 family metallo-hydrolase, partial [Kofleriaceae bacterium]|nr:M20/M25/M40 family metallo-hydrolase [Kofleriaceae bacterium]
MLPAHAEVIDVRTRTTNVVGVIRAGAAQKQPGVLVVGAHVDHLGMGGQHALDPNVKAVHNGADDNASGVAGLLEVARTLATRKGELARDVYLVAFSAEEMGDLGSFHYVKYPPTKESVVAMLNMDMIGRMRMNQLHVNGGDSAKEWKELVAPACTAARVDCTISGSGYGPSDHMPFYVGGVPVLFFFTGNHLDYHTATDDAEKINAVGAARVAQIASDVAVVTSTKPTLTYVKSPPEMVRGGDQRRRGASLGTVPSYSEDPNQPKGVRLSDVVLATAAKPSLTYVKSPPEMVRGGDQRRRGASLGTVPSY